MLNLKFRASSSAPLFLGDDGLTAAQKATLDGHVARLKAFKNGDAKDLTDNMKEEMNRLQKIQTSVDAGLIELGAGAKTYVEGLVDRIVYNYKTTLSNKEMEKGTTVEDEGIEILNSLWMRDFVKSESELLHGPHGGHPDIEDEVEKQIIDIKCSWNKDTFPKLPEKISNSTYEWQGKMYLYLKNKQTGTTDWRTFKLVYVLVSTPEGLVPDWEDDSLHYMDDLDPRLRITFAEYTLTDDDIAKIERRTAAALKYAEEYYNKLINKNK
jgi:hypothetical protein